MDPATAGGLVLGAAQLVLQMFATCVKGNSCHMLLLQLLSALTTHRLPATF